jgi:predicted class III extradiol MEMO1 family dioxygenase
LFAERLMQIEADDRLFLRRVESGDCEALHKELSRDNNVRNVDAHPALYTMFAAFPQWRAQLLAYAQAYDEEANSVVSFASMTVYAA